MEVTVGNRKVEVVGRKPRGQAEGSGEQTFDRRNTNRQRGRVRAVSLLASVKPKVHPDVRARAGRYEGTETAPYLGRDPS